MFERVFDRTSIYDMLFFNVKTVLEYPTLAELQEKNSSMYERWKFLSKNKHNMEVVDNITDFSQSSEHQFSQKVYEDNAVQYSEFSKIIAITYAFMYIEDGSIKRELKRIVNENELTVIETFMDVLNQLSKLPILCGHNIISHDIPLLIKRFIHYSGKFGTVNQLPTILKNSLSTKPWESDIIDTINVWKFNGFEYSSLMLISDFLGLKKTVDLLPLNELSKYYWNNIDKKPEEVLEFISLQSATQTNLSIQLMNKMREI